MAMAGPSANNFKSLSVMAVPISMMVWRSGSSPVISRSSQIRPPANFFMRKLYRYNALMSKDFVFTMKALSKIYPPGKKVLKDIYLSFYYGAKIGVIGLNGAGKSTLLKVMAGLEKDFYGEAFPGQGISIGYLPQEPVLDNRLTVKENVAQGMKQVTDLVAEYEKVSASFSEAMDSAKMEKMLNRQAELQDKIEQCNGWELDHT